MGCCRIYSRLTGQSRGEIQDRVLRALHKAGPRASFRRVRSRLRGRVLEIGCGTGILFEEYPAGVDVVGVEPDPDFLPLARRNAQQALARVRVVAGDGQHLPFADGRFDAAVIQLVLCSVSDPARVLGEVLRVLRPGGLVYLYEHVASRNPIYRFLQDVTAPAVYWMAEGCHWNRDTPALVHGLPLTIEDEERFHLYKGFMPPLPVLRMTGRKPHA